MSNFQKQKVKFSTHFIEKCHYKKFNLTNLQIKLFTRFFLEKNHTESNGITARFETGPDLFTLLYLSINNMLTKFDRFKMPIFERKLKFVIFSELS